MRRLGWRIARPLQIGVLTTLAVLLATPVALSQGRNDWGESDSGWSVFGGVFLPQVDTSIQFRSDTLGVTGTEIDLESNLGLDDSDSLPLLGIRWQYTGPVFGVLYGF